MKNLQRILSAIHRGDMYRALLEASAWLANAVPGEPVATLRKASSADRGKLALIFRDLLSKYPNTMLGAPVLYQYKTETSIMLLPMPHPHFIWPNKQLEFLRWLPLAAEAPVDISLPPRAMPVHTNKIGAAIALFRATPDVFDISELTIDNSWWGTLFELPEEGMRVDIAAQMLLTYPDAIEAARVMLAAATGAESPQHGGFLSDLAWQWALETGNLFRETQRHTNPQV